MVKEISRSQSCHLQLFQTAESSPKASNGAGVGASSSTIEKSSPSGCVSCCKSLLNRVLAFFKWLFCCTTKDQKIQNQEEILDLTQSSDPIKDLEKMSDISNKRVVRVHFKDVYQINTLYARLAEKTPNIEELYLTSDPSSLAPNQRAILWDRFKNLTRSSLTIYRDRADLPALNLQPHQLDLRQSADIVKSTEEALTSLNGRKIKETIMGADQSYKFQEIKMIGERIAALLPDIEIMHTYTCYDMLPKKAPIRVPFDTLKNLKLCQVTIVKK